MLYTSVKSLYNKIKTLWEKKNNRSQGEFIEELYQTNNCMCHCSGIVMK